jgi:hypothetical protein
MDTKKAGSMPAFFVGDAEAPAQGARRASR